MKRKVRKLGEKDDLVSKDTKLREMFRDFSKISGNTWYVLILSRSLNPGTLNIHLDCLLAIQPLI